MEYKSSHHVGYATCFKCQPNPVQNKKLAVNWGLGSGTGGRIGDSSFAAAPRVMGCSFLLHGSEDLLKRVKHLKVRAEVVKLIVTLYIERHADTLSKY